MLDSNDLKILTELDFHGRDNFSDIAARVGISKQLLEYRMKGLRSREVLGGFYPVINCHRLGYFYSRIFFQCGSVTAEFEHKLQTYVAKHPQLFWAYSMGGEFDYVFVYWVRTLDEFQRFIKKFLAEFGGNIRQRREEIIINVVHLSYQCFVPGSKRISFELKGGEEKLELDSLDERILKALALDARSSFTEIAARVKSNDKVVRYRVQRLEERGVIAGYRPMLNYEAAGLTYYKVFLSLDFTKGKKLAALERHLMQHPSMLYLVHGIGMLGDLDFELVTKSQPDFFKFMDELRVLFPECITGYRYLVFSRLLKVNYLPF